MSLSFDSNHWLIGIPAIFQLGCSSETYGDPPSDFEPLPSTQSEVAECPGSHFQCLDNGYCLPVFLRCNDVFDCPGKEDEGLCDEYTCPGYYRCRSSKICIHPFYLCDGQFQCPLKDDELLCELSCPDHCVCRGLAFMCSKPFAASAYTGMRFLDASGSGMTPVDLTSNIMLIHLDLSRCGFSRLETLYFPNLFRLDLSDNFITNVTTDLLHQSVHLKVFILSGNPLSYLFTLKSPVLKSLKVLDLSRVLLPHILTDMFILFPSIETLNLSSAGVEVLEGSEGEVFTMLHTLDLRACPLVSFPRQSFRRLSRLRTVYVDNYKLCCYQVLPADFNIKNCRGPSDIVSSCDSILGVALYQISFSILTVCALLGNTLYFVWIKVAKNSQTSVLRAFLSHLAACDFMMGVHLAIVTAADRIHLGTYVWQDTAWRNSLACQVSGFLHVLSTDVSALLTCMMTLDLCVALRCPHRHTRVGAVAAHTACAGVWAGCVLLAAVPLMSGTPPWQMYGQSGVCQPLVPLLEGHPSQVYFLTVVVGLTLVSLLVSLAGQLFLAMLVSEQSDILTAWQANRDDSHDLTLARRVSVMLLFDALCWSWLCFVMVLTSAGVPIPTQIQLGTAMCALPLKAALHPAMYFVGCLRERQHRTQRQRLFKRLGVAKRV